ncbi:MAG TPA: transcriptional regulator [Candidatus Thermoplasmatota archaeon]|nr:transcriptional regulator [Candidatus Thermoplasmatota archaeon]
MRGGLVDDVREVLSRGGYLATLVEGASAFTIVARRDEHLLLVKILQNVDAFAEDAARELLSVASTLDATALLVGVRSSARDLEDGAVYLRHGVRILTPTTLSEFLLDGTPPLVYAAPGGFYVRIDGAKLRELRERRGLSLGELATSAGVSRRAIGMYEDGMSAMVDVAARLEEHLDTDLVQPVDPFEKAPATPPVPLEELADPFEREVLTSLKRLGFQVAPARRAPFDGVARAEKDVVVAGISPGPDLERRAFMLTKITEIAEVHGTFVVERRHARLEVAGTPLLDRKDLKDADEPSGILDLLSDRKRRTK